MFWYAKLALIHPKISIIGMKVIKVGLRECIMYFMFASIAFFCISMAFEGFPLSSLICFWCSFISSFSLFIKAWSVVYFVIRIIITEMNNDIIMTAINGGILSRGPRIILRKS